MDYSKQEDRLTNNKYHYYIKHYLNNTKNQIGVSTENISTEAQKTPSVNQSTFNRDSSSRKNFKLLTKNNEIIDRANDAFEKDSFLTATTNTIANLQQPEPTGQAQLAAPKINVLKNLKSKLGSASKKKAKVIDMKLNDGLESDSRLSVRSPHETTLVEAFKNETGNEEAVLNRVVNEPDNRQSGSQNKQFLERIQRVYNRKFKTNPNNKIKPNQNTNVTEQITELGPRKSPLRKKSSSFLFFFKNLN